jgi:kinesin family protein 2/24
MNLLAEVDQPGSAIDTYVAQLEDVLIQKAAAIAELQVRRACSVSVQHIAMARSASI